MPEGKEARPGEAAAAAAEAAAVDEVGKGDDRRQTYNEEGETLGCEGALAPQFLCGLIEAPASCIRCEQRGEQRIIERERGREAKAMLRFFFQGDMISRRYPESEKEKKVEERARKEESRPSSLSPSSLPFFSYGDDLSHALGVASFFAASSGSSSTAPDATDGGRAANPNDGDANAANAAARRIGAPPGPLRRRRERRAEPPLRIQGPRGVPRGLRGCTGALRAGTVRGLASFFVLVFGVGLLSFALPVPRSAGLP